MQRERFYPSQSTELGFLCHLFICAHLRGVNYSHHIVMIFPASGIVIDHKSIICKLEGPRALERQVRKV